MKILVLNGSPKGEYSITIQTVLYLQKLYTKHEFEIVHVGQRIKALEKDFSNMKEQLEDADVLLFSYPVYTFLAPSQLHRFIELMKEHKVNVKDKYATQITTSKHFYDITAHKYIEENCYDLGLRYIRGLSADMEDLLKDQGKKDAINFFKRFLWSVKKEIYETKPNLTNTYIMDKCEVSDKKINQRKDKDIVIITDVMDMNSNLGKMIQRFQNQFTYETRIVNISEYPFQGGCLGCFRCAVSEKCVYKDEFDIFLREKIQKADAIIYAFAIKDHSMGSRFKMYDDRNFCNGHRTTTSGMPVGYLVSGAYSQESNLKMVIEARSETGGNYLTKVASDEFDVNKQVDDLGKIMHFALETKHTIPQNFYGVGGMKIFRDLIYEMRGMMKADHKFYKKQGIYDFPQKKLINSLKMYAVGMLLSNEKILNNMGNKMNEAMIAPYQKMFKEMEKKK